MAGGAIVAGLIAVALAVAVAVGIIAGVGVAVRRIWGFIAGEVLDLSRLIGAIVAGLVFSVAALVNGALGRSASAVHYLTALQREGEALAGCVYRVLVGHPARLLGLTPLTDVLEKRVPGVLAGSPGQAEGGARAGRFAGYTIVGTMPAGGSGARLYLATPEPGKRAELERAARASGDASPIERVVIKSFVLGDGSDLPQIVRESRVLTAASQMGLVLDHALGGSEFHYVTRYQPGEPLTRVIARLHASAEAGGLSTAGLRTGLSYAADLLETLRSYHRASLWHKDVKPDNIIVDEAAGRARLVDFGLVTPLRSGLTLTTHGTEYFRDPEMVRMALRGVRVQDVDGARFDVYSAGAVLFALIENTFPAHAGLSRITRRCPDAVRWIVHRAMADYDKRYRSAAEMLEDVRAVLDAGDPWAMKIGVLPSVRREAAEDERAETGGIEEAALSAEVVVEAGERVRARLPEPEPTPAAPAPASVATAAPSPPGPRLRVTGWLTGRYVVGD
jgi:hypothetical protein